MQLEVCKNKLAVCNQKTNIALTKLHPNFDYIVFVENPVSIKFSMLNACVRDESGRWSKLTLNKKNNRLVSAVYKTNKCDGPSTSGGDPVYLSFNGPALGPYQEKDGHEIHRAFLAEAKDTSRTAKANKWVSDFIHRRGNL